MLWVLRNILPDEKATWVFILTLLPSVTPVPEVLFTERVLNVSTDDGILYPEVPPNESDDFELVTRFDTVPDTAESRVRVLAPTVNWPEFRTNLPVTVISPVIVVPFRRSI